VYPGARADGTVPGMRHLGSLIAGIVAAPLGWLLLAFGQVSSGKAFANVASTGTYHTKDFIRPLIFLAVAGIVIGLIATLRISPVGPLVAGVPYAGSYVALLIAPKRTYEAFNYNIKVFHETADLTLPLTTGAGLAIGAALLVAVVSVGRWRRPAPPPFEETGETAPPPVTDNTLSGTTPWSAFGQPTAKVGESATDTPRTTELPSRGPGAWPSRTGPDETTESVPAKGRSPWDTPLRDSNTKP
jgi:hypothetical protein